MVTCDGLTPTMCHANYSHSVLEQQDEAGRATSLYLFIKVPLAQVSEVVKRQDLFPIQIIVVGS